MHVSETAYLTKLNTHTSTHSHRHSHWDIPAKGQLQIHLGTKKKEMKFYWTLLDSLSESWVELVAIRLRSVLPADWQMSKVAYTHTHTEQSHTHIRAESWTHSYTLRVNVKLNSFLAFGRLVSSVHFHLSYRANMFAQLCVCGWGGEV